MPSGDWLAKEKWCRKSDLTQAPEKIPPPR